MKTFALLIFTLGTFTVSAQVSQDTLAKWLNNKQFIFVATSVDPLHENTRNLTGTYDLRVKTDSLISYLPYFGHSQVSSMTPDDGGLDFTSTKFKYAVSPGKKGGWVVTINVNDQTNVSKYIVSVFNDGVADLIVTSNFRDQISFRGYVTKLR